MPLKWLLINSYPKLSLAFSLCCVSLFLVPFCCLPFHPSHFASLSSLGGQNMWQERKKSGEMPGLDSATYIKASKHPLSPRPNIHPHASRARLRFHFIQWSQTNPNIGSTQAFLPATSIPLFIYTSVDVAMFYSSHFHLVVAIFSKFPLPFFSPSGSSSHFELHFLAVVWGIACSGEREQLSAACSGTKLSGLGFLNGGELSHLCHINPCCATHLQTDDIMGLPDPDLR